MNRMFEKIKTKLETAYFLYRNPEIRNPKLHLHPIGEFISDSIRLRRKYYELDLLVWCANNLNYSYYVDIGANIGNHVHFFSSLGARCVAFEPSDDNFSLLKKNASNAICYHCALAEKISIEKFVSYGTSMGNSNLISSFSGTIQPWGGGEIKISDVSTNTLDNFNLKNVTLLKIDVEGAEMRVLSGARETLEKFKPAIWIEIQSDKDLENCNYPYKRKDIVNLLESMGYGKVRGENEDTNFFFVNKNISL